MAAITTELAGVSALLSSDPAAAAALIEEQVVLFEQAAAKVENDEVLEAVLPAATALRGLSDLTAAWVLDPQSIDHEAVSASREELATTMRALAEVCE